ncbi:MAG: aminopeptidase [Bacteroidota bacterium]
MKKVSAIINILFDLLFFSLLLFVISNTEMGTYLVSQAVGQIKIIFLSEDINELKINGKFSAEQLEKLKLIDEIKSYSVEQLNFKPSNSYTSFYDQKNKSLIWNVTACDPYAFNAYDWNYPILGKLSYKGFFDSIKAVKEYSKLKSLGYDVDVSGVQAWSTLGYLDDPIFSEMLKKPKGELCELIFHELFHGTIYAPGAAELNENLAEFVAKNATIRFLKSDNINLTEYTKKMEKEKFINRIMLNGIDTLTKKYNGINSGEISTAKAEELKKREMNRILENLKESKLIKIQSMEKITKKLSTSGNAYLMHFKRYNFLEDSLNRVLDERFNGRLDLMILDLKRNISSI